MLLLATKFVGIGVKNEGLGWCQDGGDSDFFGLAVHIMISCCSMLGLHASFEVQTGCAGVYNHSQAPGIGRVACFTGEAAPQAPGSWVRPIESRMASQ
jgi:hypothetical protein